MCSHPRRGFRGAWPSARGTGKQRAKGHRLQENGRARPDAVHRETAGNHPQAGQLGRLRLRLQNDRGRVPQRGLHLQQGRPARRGHHQGCHRCRRKSKVTPEEDGQPNRPAARHEVHCGGRHQGRSRQDEGQGCVDRFLGHMVRSLHRRVAKRQEDLQETESERIRDHRYLARHQGERPQAVHRKGKHAVAAVL